MTGHSPNDLASQPAGQAAEAPAAASVAKPAGELAQTPAASAAPATRAFGRSTDSKCTVHFLDTKLANEWLSTRYEYLEFVRNPLQAIPLSRLWRFEQSSWETAFREWSVLQFYVGVLNALVRAVVKVTEEDGNVVSVGIDMVVQMLMAYLLAHIAWFAVTRKGGCLCCIVACIQSEVILAIWGILNIAWGFLLFIDSLTSLTRCNSCIIWVVVQAVYSVILFYLGYCCIKLWQLKGSEIIPEEVEVQGPEGEKIGAADLA